MLERPFEVITGCRITDGLIDLCIQVNVIGNLIIFRLTVHAILFQIGAWKDMVNVSGNCNQIAHLCSAHQERVCVQTDLGGQKYIEDCTEKIRELRELIEEDDLDVDIQVDGGINEDTLETVIRAGANLLVAGSYVFKGDLASNVRIINEKMRRIAETVQ